MKNIEHVQPQVKGGLSMFVRKTLLLWLCVVLLLLIIPGCGAEEVVSTTESGFTTRFNPNTGTLTVSGEGTLEDLYPREWVDGDPSLWSYIVEENNTIKALVVEEGITKLVNCFNDMIAVQKIILPTSLKIVARSFIHATSLRKLAIPYTLSQIADFSFNDCENLSAITFNGKIKLGHLTSDLKTTVFSNLPSLTKICIPARSVLCNAFNYCDKLYNVTLGELVSCHKVESVEGRICWGSFYTENATTLESRIYRIHSLDSNIREGVYGLKDKEGGDKLIFLL